MGVARTLLCSAAALLLVGFPLVAAHGDEMSPTMEMGGTQSGHDSAMIADASNPDSDLFVESSYFRHPEYASWMYAHIALMSLAWVVVLPVGVMLSAARAPRYAILVQFLFLIVNALGLFTSIVYDARTPDLYENNAHHKIGWAVTWIAGAWILMGLVNFCTMSTQKAPRAPAPSHPMTAHVMAQYQRIQDFQQQQDPRYSADSGQGTERNSASLCSGSRSPSSEDVLQKFEQSEEPQDEEHEEEHDAAESRSFLKNSKVDRFLSRNIPQFATGRALRAINFLYVVLERFQLLLGFLAILTGLVTFGGIFRDREIFSGLAHWIKGGIFFWYGLLTLGRWMGAFADFGWAWNVRPKHPLVSSFAARVPTAEFTESFVIFLYGATNVFLEHLNQWGRAWSAQDLEHISITIMFFGGGLLGMIIESETARKLLNTNIIMKKEESVRFGGMAEEQREEWETPSQYKTSLNVMPAVVILLLGLMMSGHHQASMVSTMLHAQWGTLFVGFALARGVTYIMLYLKPPTSHFPSRPPSELVAAFCLTSGGLIFMGSAKDMVQTLEANNLDAMFIFTVMMGLTCLILAWTTICYAIKGWATRKEAKCAGKAVMS